MNAIRSVLMQDISDLTSSVAPAIIECSNSLSARRGIDIKIVDFYLWMICYLLSKRHYYDVTNFDYKTEESKTNINFELYSLVNKHLADRDINLEGLFNYYVRTPLIYEDIVTMDVKLTDNACSLLFIFWWHSFSSLV